MKRWILKISFFQIRRRNEFGFPRAKRQKVSLDDEPIQVTKHVKGPSFNYITQILPKFYSRGAESCFTYKMGILNTVEYQTIWSMDFKLSVYVLAVAYEL